MNKMLIVLFAVCLVSAQAFVKRDAPEPATNNNYLETVQKKLQELSKDINSQMATAFDPEHIKKNLNELVDNVNKAMNDLKGKPAA